MQPCVVCGGEGIDQYGHCTTCSTYRGLPHPSPPMPISTPPDLPQPYSPYLPAPAPPAKRSFAVPLIALSATLIVVTVAIVVVALNRGGGSAAAGNLTSTSPVQSAVDPCVVGDWTVVEHTEHVPVDGVGTVTITGGDGETVHIGPDGRVTQDYGGGTVLIGTHEGRTLRATLRGVVEFTIRTTGTAVEFDEVDPGTATVTITGTVAVNTTMPVQPSNDPARYVCSADSSTIENSRYRIRMRR